jgi:hypothetical protein
MENVILVADTKIFAVNGNKSENFADSILYYDEKGELHSIDLAVCAKNYQQEYKLDSTTCIGERDIVEGYFLLYTSGVKTKIVFKRRFVCNLRSFYLLGGSKKDRFLKLQSLLQQTKYTTRDMS